MNRRLATVQRYLNAYENDARFGANGEFIEAFDQEMSFAPDELSADGRPATMQEPVSKPYILNITNSSAGTVNAIVFGYNKNYLSTNFGNGPGITITSGTPNVTYVQLLGQSNNQPFDIGQWKWSSTNASQLDQQMTVTWYDANGRQCDDPVDVNKDPYQFDPNAVVFWYPAKIDANAFLTIPILATTTLTMRMYPRQVAAPSRPLVGGTSVKRFITPKIAGNNTTVVLAPKAGGIVPTVAGDRAGG